MTDQRKAPSAKPATIPPSCPVAVIAEWMGGVVVDVNRTQSAELTARRDGDAREAEDLNSRSEALLNALHSARDALPGIRAESHFGALAQVAVMAAFADWMSETNDTATRYRLADAMGQMAHSVASFLAAQGQIDREHAMLTYFLPTYMDRMQPRRD